MPGLVLRSVGQGHGRMAYTFTAITFPLACHFNKVVFDAGQVDILKSVSFTYYMFNV